MRLRKDLKPNHLKPRLTEDGRCYLNVGCGTLHSTQWNNIDLVSRSEFVLTWDVTWGLPYPDCTFEAVYSSHLLEHLKPDDGEALVAEFRRVMRPDGILRIVVPDLERICREYLSCLDAFARRPAEVNRQKYEWSVLALIDQMVREEPGGLMIKKLRHGDFDAAYLRQRSGLRPPSVATGPIGDEEMVNRKRALLSPDAILSSLLRSYRAVRQLSSGNGQADPRKMGEVHRWMYDRVSLARLLEAWDFVDFQVLQHDRSAIPHWREYRLDTADSGDAPRKPDSIFVEARKPAVAR
ncbi:MAG: methyltransferase domain-containing protein [Anaerolineales bacterium]